MAEEMRSDQQDRGLFDFMKKGENSSKPQEENEAAQFEDKVKIEDEGEKKPASLLDKLHRSNSTSSSSSSEEEGEGEGEEKKKKKKKEKKDKVEDTAVPVEKVEDHPVPEDQSKTGCLDKFKQKLPGGSGNKTHDQHPAAPAETHEPASADKEKEKKGFLDKIKEKLPGHHSNTQDQTAPAPHDSH